MADVMKGEINSAATHFKATVVGNRKISSYHLIQLRVGEIAEKINAGNFLALTVGNNLSSLVTRRVFAIYRVGVGEYGQGIIEIVVAPKGEGSTWLTERQINDQVWVTLPLGNSFKIPTTPVSAILVGGGYGSAPLFWLAENLKKKGNKVHLLLGASTSNKIFAPIEGKRTADSSTIVTDDGSAGYQGKVTDYLPDLIKSTGADIVYSCGPSAMMAAITKITKAENIYHHASIEESMACGIGICMVCVLPVKQSDGIYVMERSCITGPIFDAETINWESNKTIPEGTLGYDRF
jgi:dihydroorotate dehydrogenase electron transfer subunit